MNFISRKRQRAVLLILFAVSITFSISCGGDPGRRSGPGDDDVADGVLRPARQPVLRDPGFYGVNIGSSDMLHGDVSWRRELEGLSGDLTFTAEVSMEATGAGSAGAGLILGWDGTTIWDGSPRAVAFEIFPNEGRWKLYDVASRHIYADGYDGEVLGAGSWHELAVSIDNGLARVYLDGLEKTVAGGVPLPLATGTAGLRVHDGTAYFDDVVLRDGVGVLEFSDDFEAGAEVESGAEMPERSGLWSAGQPRVWSHERPAIPPGEQPRAVYSASTLLGRESLMDPELSPRLEPHFDLLEEAGASDVRIFINWNDVQSEGPDSYFWDYTDAMVIKAREHHLQVLPGLLFAPSWAIPEQARSDDAAAAVPPSDNTDFARFVDAAVRRYMPGGALSREQGWDDGYGVTAWELGHEYNAGRIAPMGRTLFASWLGSLDQFLDYLMAGHDAVKSACPDCLVTNGGATDNLLPYYPSRLDPSGRRQYLWQGVEDLYERIQQRHPTDPRAADRYFDILSIHAYQWYLYTENGQEPDSYGVYAFPDPRWYQDRLGNVTAVMKRYGYGDREIWVTEAAYASADNGDPYRGNLDEAGQAAALEMVYRECAKFPQVSKVYWWYGYDVRTYSGLIRGDLSPKPSYLSYAWLAGGDAVAGEAAPGDVTPTSSAP
ncbi:MAG: hypothetical protein ACYC6O_04100 [Thermoleophilia bacterium]